MIRYSQSPYSFESVYFVLYKKSPYGEIVEKVSINKRELM